MIRVCALETVKVSKETGLSLTLWTIIMNFEHCMVVGFMGGSSNASIAQIGISVEPLTELANQTPAANTTASNVNSFVQFSSKMLENLYNYVSSFGLSQAQMTPNPTEVYVPISSMRTWFENFKRKLEQDPNFWKS